MKSSQEAPECVEIEKRYPATRNGYPTKFERVLKAFKGVFFEEQGGEFTGFEGETENSCYYRKWTPLSNVFETLDRTAHLRPYYKQHT